MTDDNITQPDQQDSEKTPREAPLQIPELTEVDMLSAKMVELENSVNQYKDQLLRKAAEFENYKKRTENDYASIIKFSKEELIMKLLPVLDDFERSLKASKVQSGDPQGTSANESVFMKGVELIYSKFKKLLETQGVKHFDVVGAPFDPQLHDALLQLPRTDVPPHTVIEEVEKGYMLNDKVIRHAKVIVSAEPSTTEPQDGQQPKN
ncbi:MAG: nucleotide exchange factor GrpE [Ignavibacteria bacterium]|nr:nucleotide exchange factor GrpE [Ignavibacteria bacterium]MBI3765299.1 nucleotide exchange factor GrpE [Ignavibacteriales bacterium]